MPADSSLSAKKVLTKEIHFRPAFDFDIAENFGHAGQSHRLLVTNKGETGNRVRGDRDGRFELELFAHRHLVGVLHPFGDQHAASAAHAQPLAVEELIERRSVAVHATIEIDAGLNRLGPQYRPLGNVNLFVFVDEFDSRHGQHLHGGWEEKTHAPNLSVLQPRIYSRLPRANAPNRDTETGRVTRVSQQRQVTFWAAPDHRLHSASQKADWGCQACCPDLPERRCQLAVGPSMTSRRVSRGARSVTSASATG